jgi:hypothetical protein
MPIPVGHDGSIISGTGAASLSITGTVSITGTASSEVNTIQQYSRKEGGDGKFLIILCKQKATSIPNIICANDFRRPHKINIARFLNLNMSIENFAI